MVMSEAIPDAVVRVASEMSGFGQRWALCGGWAIDSWLGRVTRDHADADVSILEKHQREVFDYFHDWRLVGHDPDEGHDEAWDGHWLSGPGHIHAKAADGFDLEVLLAESSGDEWVLNRSPRVSDRLSDCVRPSRWGLPTVVPEVLLFFKATRCGPSSSTMESVSTRRSER